MDYIFSDKISSVKPSAIREIFKFTADPSVIPFAAGNPSALSFPAQKMDEISSELFKNQAGKALQYSITEGYPVLRGQVIDRLKKRLGFSDTSDSLVITSGGQQGLDLTCKILCNEGDTVICENPSFIGALNAFRAYNVNLVGVDMENDGMNIEKLENALKTNKNVKFIYLIPTFQNPMGITMSPEKRKAVYALAIKYDVLILEDDPYGELRFSGQDILPIKSLDTCGRVIYVSSFSKILSAGMRIGYLFANSKITEKIVVAKQVNDVHTNIFFQMLCSEFIIRHGLDGHIADIKSLYKQKSALMLSKMDECFDKKISYTRPEGGLFLWCCLPVGYDAFEFSKICISNKIAIVPGNAFLANESQKSNAFRLNYSTPSDEQIKNGIETLAKLISDYIKV